MFGLCVECPVKEQRHHEAQKQCHEESDVEASLTDHKHDEERNESDPSREHSDKQHR